MDDTENIPPPSLADAVAALEKRVDQLGEFVAQVVERLEKLVGSGQSDQG
jgi:hypothetical protein